MTKHITAFLFLFLCAHCAQAQNTFEVTSNADSGPGTLREAITLANANGSTIRDSIAFNLADQTIAGRTITLSTELPLLSSNIVIDGSSQQGTAIGVSDARLRITAPVGVFLHQVFGITDAHDIGIYGIHFFKLPIDYETGTAIGLFNAARISIGSRGRGNYFSYVRIAVKTLFRPAPGKGYLSDISFKSNIVNLSEDGNSLTNNSSTLELTNVKNIEIGGEDEKEGNFITGSGGESSIYVNADTSSTLNFGYLKLLNNKFGAILPRRKDCLPAV